MKTNIKGDLSVLTTINELSINRLFNKISWCICDSVEKSLYQGDNVSEFDFGFGNLIIKVDGDEIKYKFIPSKELEKSLIDTIVNEKNPLISAIEDNLIQKITNIYKDLL